MFTVPSMPPLSKNIEPPVLGEFTYSDGKVVKKLFKNKKELHWYAHNEGDHLKSYTYLEIEDV